MAQQERCHGEEEVRRHLTQHTHGRYAAVAQPLRGVAQQPGEGERTTVQCRVSKPNVAESASTVGATPATSAVSTDEYTTPALHTTTALSSSWRTQPRKGGVGCGRLRDEEDLLAAAIARHCRDARVLRAGLRRSRPRIVQRLPPAPPPVRDHGETGREGKGRGGQVTKRRRKSNSTTKT